VKIINSYKEAYGLLQETQPKFRELQGLTQIKLDAGSAMFGVSLLFSLSHDQAFTLLRELEKRDLPLPEIIHNNNRILIGASKK
jgi:hypothetical protein